MIGWRVLPLALTIAIAGDVLPAEAKRLAEKYFGLLPKAPPPAPVRTVEPKQEGERRGLVESPAQPTLIIGYKRPDQLHKDDPVFDVLASLLSSGRTGMLYRDLVRDRRIALAAEVDDPLRPGAQLIGPVGEDPVALQRVL